MAPEGNESPKAKPAPRRATNELKKSLLSDKKFLWSVGWRIGLGIIFILGLLGIRAWTLYQSASESIQKQIETTTVNLSNRIASSDLEIRTLIATTDSELSNRVYSSKAEITNLIVHTFESSNITTIVKEVAADRAGQILEQQVQPEVAKLTNDIAAFSQKIDDLRKTKEQQDLQIQTLNSNLVGSLKIEDDLQSVIADAKQALSRLDEQSKFVTTCVLADHDDRRAYEKLVKWGRDSSFKFKDAAYAVADKIDSGYYKYHGSYTVVPWSDIPAADKKESWTMLDVISWWRVAGVGAAKDYIDYVSSRTNLTDEQKLAFLRNVYLVDSHNSLYAQTTAAEFVAGKLNANYNPCFAFGDIEKHWSEYIATNHLFSTVTNLPANGVYDIITSTETNRFLTIRAWGDVRFVVFKLRYPAIKGTIEGKWIDYSTAIGGDLSVPNPQAFYRNLVWTYFNITNDEVKLEFKYEKDASTTNVVNIEVSTNKMTVDHSAEIPIPAP